jgi:hypothetical protein
MRRTKRVLPRRMRVGRAVREATACEYVCTGSARRANNQTPPEGGLRLDLEVRRGRVSQDDERRGRCARLDSHGGRRRGHNLPIVIWCTPKFPEFAWRESHHTNCPARACAAKRRCNDDRVCASWAWQRAPLSPRAISTATTV